MINEWLFCKEYRADIGFLFDGEEGIGEYPLKINRKWHYMQMRKLIDMRI